MSSKRAPADPNVTVYRDRPPFSAATLGFFVFLVLVLLYATSIGNGLPKDVDLLLILVLLFFLARYLSTRYAIDAVFLHASRIVGGRSVRLDTIRKVEFSNLRDLGTVGTYSLWGWRGRVWSPMIGRFDTVNTVSSGLLVTGGGAPVFISPHDAEEFRRELSRRVRSVTGGFDPTAPLA